MEETLRDLLEIQSVNLRAFNPEIETHGFTCLGTADSIPILDVVNNSVIIWHAQRGILPLTGREIVRLAVDYPESYHWILSEREVNEDCYAISSMSYEIWNPKMISNWVGKAVLSGDLIAKKHKHMGDSVISSPATTISTLEPESKSMRSLLDPNSWLSQRGMDGSGFSPVLLQARLWSVSGNLIGPNNESEMGEWSLIEDPWVESLTIFEEMEGLVTSPNLRIAKPTAGSWLSEKALLEKATTLLEVRRKGDFVKSDSSTSVRSMILQRWSLDADKASIASKNIVIPGWEIHLEKGKLLHGRNGRLFEYQLL